MVERVKLQSHLKVVEYYKKLEDFVYSSLEVMKLEIEAFLHIVVDDVKMVDPKFSLHEVGYLCIY